MIGIYIANNRMTRYADLCARGYKRDETRNRDTLGKLVGQRVEIIRTGTKLGGGKYKPEIIGCVTITGKRFCTREEFRTMENYNRHLIPPGSLYDCTGKGKWCYSLGDPVLYDEPKPLPENRIMHGRVWCEY